METFKATEIIKTHSGQEVKIIRIIGSGGQGEVYEVECENTTLALKWYYEHQATEKQKNTIQNIINRSSPCPSFLWPLTIVTTDTQPKSFGYLMPLRDKRYKSIIYLMKRRITPSYRNLIKACYHLVNGFHQLHSKGLCYKDISFGNLFFNPDNGDIMICDNDNVEINNSKISGVLGTPRFMAPEIVRAEHGAIPNTETDLFSLSVLLFYMLLWSHPLEGKKEADIKCFDLPAMKKIYGTEPVFIFDPNNDTNRPVKGVHDNAIIFWGIYPEFLKRYFTRAFTEGLHSPHKRVRETEWCDALIRLLDSILYCQNCGVECFYDEDKVKSSNQHTCWHCNTNILIPYRMKINHPKITHPIMLNHDSKLYLYHINSSPDTTVDFTISVAEVVRHPNRPDIWGLKNTSNEIWTMTGLNNEVKEIPPGNSVTLSEDLKINFGTTIGEIRFER